MTLDGGWGLIISTVLGIILAGVGVISWAHFTRVEKDLDDVKSDVSNAHNHSQDSHIELLEFKAYCERNFVSVSDFKDLAKQIFDKLDGISNKLDTKADK